LARRAIQNVAFVEILQKVLARLQTHKSAPPLLPYPEVVLHCVLSVNLAFMARKPLLILWALTICAVAVFSLLPGTAAPVVAMERLPVSDRLVHFLVYMVLALLPASSIRPRQRGQYSTGAMFLLGLLLELAQIATPGREFELGDLVANAIGVAVGILIARLLN
jgi:VanZ family protein